MRCVELFAGAGGAALGLEAAGIHHAALCEWDPDACATLRAAGLGPVVEGDVRDLDAIEAVAGPGPIPLLWASPPCQVFSTAGKRRGAADDRDGVPWTIDAIDRFRPRWFLGENVRGLLCHSSEGHPDPMRCPRCYLDGVIMPQLEERFGYAGWFLLDAADLGVPQHRRRIIIWAGPAPLRAPASTHGPPGQGDLFRRVKPWVTMGEALGLGPFTWEAARNNQYILAPAPTVTVSEDKGTRATKASGYQFNHGPDRASDALFAATGRRRLTVAECCILQSLPPTHPLRGIKRSKYAQVGNAVPPPMAQAVAEVLLAADASLRGDSSQTPALQTPASRG